MAHNYRFFQLSLKTFVDSPFTLLCLVTAPLRFQICQILVAIIFWKVLKSEHPSSQNSPPLCPFSSTSNPPSSRPPLYKVPKKNYSSNLRICRFVSGTAAVFCHFLFAESIFFSCNTLSIKKSHYNSFTKQSLHSIETDNFKMDFWYQQGTHLKKVDRNQSRSVVRLSFS